MLHREEKPVEVISLCGTDGKLQPLRFRFEDENGYWQTAYVMEVLDVHEVTHVRAERFRYLCKTEVNKTPHLMELAYVLREHLGTLAGKLY